MSEIDTTTTEAAPSEAHSLSDQLRADVRLLTTLLGQVLSESGSSGLFEDVEALRQATIFDTAEPGLVHHAQRQWLRELRGELENGGIRLKSLRERTLCDCL